MNSKEYKISLVSLGCAKNQVDSEIMLGILKDSGYIMTDDMNEADVIIVNTCGFIESAKQEAIDALLEAASHKKTGVCRGVIAAGCLAQRYYNEIRAELPEVDAVLGINGYAEISKAVESCLNGRRYDFNRITGDMTYLDMPRVIASEKGSAYIKISEGCDNRCSYCAIPYIRGRFRSRPMEEITAEAKRLALAGVGEIVLIAQDTSRYGKDIYSKPCLAELLHELNGIDGIKWIRVMYLYPDEIAEELINAMNDCDKVVPYVDLPLQHINARILSDMNRRGTPDEIRSVIRSFREKMKSCVIRTSLIVGFPGETDGEFAELEEFVRETRFDRLGVFEYSPEEGTPAFRMRGKVRASVKKERYDSIMRIQQDISLENNRKRVGKIYDVLVEGVSDDGIFYYGRSYAEGPDNIDGRIYFTAEEPVETGSFVKVKILIAEEYDLTGCQISV